MPFWGLHIPSKVPCRNVDSYQPLLHILCPEQMSAGGPVHVDPSIFAPKERRMSRKLDPKKEEADRLQKILLELLKEEENKYCADCQAKTPRWASFNLGVFVCIRCAGIHRNLGVHISKVRSVTLDSWTAEQVRGMQEMGNDRAKSLYEATLPEGFRRPVSDSQMEQFIRAKYEQKRYYPKDGRLPPAREPRRVAVSANGHSIVKQSTPKKEEPSLLDFSSPPSGPSTTRSSGGDSLVDDLGGMALVISGESAPVEDDPFGDFVSAGPPSVAPPFSSSPSTPASGFADFSKAPSDPFSSPAATTGGRSATSGGAADLFGIDTSVVSQQSAALSTIGPVSDGPKSNADILALFGSSGVGSTSAPAPFVNLPTGGFPATAYGLSQFAAPASSAAAPGQFPSGAGQFAALSGYHAPSEILAQQPHSLSMTATGLTDCASSVSSTVGMNPHMPLQTAHTPVQTRAMKAFEGIDKDMFILASATRAALPSQPVVSQAPPPLTTPAHFPPAAPNTDDLLGLF